MEEVIEDFLSSLRIMFDWLALGSLVCVMHACMQHGIWRSAFKVDSPLICNLQ